MQCTHAITFTDRSRRILENKNNSKQKCLKENRKFNLICAQAKQHQHTHNSVQHNKL